MLKEAREAKSESAFIILTARSETDDKILGLDLGADDYLAKPFSLMELNARMQAITRRKHGLTSNTFQVGEFEMDISNRTVHHNKIPVNLTIAKEVNINFFSLKKYLNRRDILDRFDLLLELGSRSVKIVENMLRFCRSADSKFSHHSIIDIIDETLILAANQYDADKNTDFKKIEIIKKYARNIPPILCEKSEIQQVFLNLF